MTNRITYDINLNLLGHTFYHIIMQVGHLLVNSSQLLLIHRRDQRVVVHNRFYQTVHLSDSVWQETEEYSTINCSN